MKKVNKNSGFAVGGAVIIVLVVALVGVLGWVYYTNSQKQQEKLVDTSQKKDDQKTAFCSDGEDTMATNGVFCSEDWEFKLHVPDELKGKLVAGQASQKDAQQQLLPSTQAYVAHEESAVGGDSYAFDIAKYPLKSFVFPSYAHTTFDPVRKMFVDVMAMDGRAAGSETQHSTVDGQKVYVMGIGDAGYVASASAFVKGDDVFVIQMASSVNPGLVEGVELTFQQKVESLQGYFGIYTSMPQNMKLQIKK